MKRTLIRYKTKPGMADQNAELIAAVFAELKATKPEGLRYLTLRLDDDSFVHFVESESDSGSALPSFAAFKAFQSGIRERCIEPPQPSGSYHRRQLSDARRTIGTVSEKLNAIVAQSAARRSEH